MIDLARIKQRQTPGRIVLECLLNTPQILLILYGLMCLTTGHGQLLRSVSGRLAWHLHLVPVSGTVAALAGWLYAGFGLFVYLSDGSPPGENRLWLWRLGRALLRWGALAVALVCFVEAESRLSGRHFSSHGFPPVFLIKIVGFIVGFVALLLFLLAMFQREQVKRELGANSCQPLHIWWIPAAYWIPWGVGRYATGFRVVYADSAGLIHSGYCLVYRSFWTDWRWGNRRVLWLTDTVRA